MCWWEAHTAVCLLLGHNMSCLTRSLSSNRFAAEQELLMLLITHQKVVRDSHRHWMCRAVISFGLFPWGSGLGKGWVVGLRFSPLAEQPQAPVAVQSPILPTATPRKQGRQRCAPMHRDEPFSRVWGRRGQCPPAGAGEGAGGDAGVPSPLCWQPWAPVCDGGSDSGSVPLWVAVGPLPSRVRQPACPRPPLSWCWPGCIFPLHRLCLVLGCCHSPPSRAPLPRLPHALPARCCCAA